MEENFVQSRDSPKDTSRGYRFDDSSLVISDSDDDNVVEISTKECLVIDESNENVWDAGVSENTTPTKNRSNSITISNNIPLKEVVKCLFEKSEIVSDSDTNSSEDTEGLSISYSPTKARGKKRKDFTHDNTREDIKELKLNSSSESLNEAEDNDIDHRISDLKVREPSDSPVVIIDSDSHSGENSESEALSLAKKEIGVGNIDPLIAQKRAITVCKLQQLQNQLATTKRLLTEGNIEVLPDKGEKLRECVLEQEKEIQKVSLELENINLIQNSENKEIVMGKEPRSARKEPLFTKNESSSDTTDTIDDYSYFDINNIPTKPTTNPELKVSDKKAQGTSDKEFALTVDRLQYLHGSLVTCPSEDEKADDPRGLKVPLMPHQRHALAWLLWREQQRPPGGVLADDMGLGKTLTMISLIIATLSKENSFDSSDESDDSDGEWTNKPLCHKGGTLIICPASLLAQWEKEVRDKCKSGLLSVEVYHGSKRESIPSRLAKRNIVITTYNIVAREHKSKSTLYKIRWKRITLDEAHIIRNHKSHAAEAVFELAANKRWALTGTPIQNREIDLYSILKFLKCSPFDDLRVWKRWVDNKKTAAGHQRLATVMKALMLRRTKQELQAQGRLDSLPGKFTEEVTVKLDPQEQLVYGKILIYSRTLFAQFLAQRAEKDHMFDLYGGKYDKPTFLSNPNKKTQFTKAQDKLLALHADIKTHEILVLLLRLRQVCCHPALIHAMLDQEDIKESGIMDIENLNPNFLRRISNISLNGNEDHENFEEEDIGIDGKIVENLLTAQNPVFDNNRVSSKMRVLLQTVEEILQKGDDKIIVISQWASMLDIIASNLYSLKATFAMFTGKVAIKDRQSIVDSFNDPHSGTRILLLSLTAGGVGLNLVGGNHLLLFDIHWNPQLETQAQDRIYRFGQRKNVYIYKFICSNTIEERIKVLQEQKIAIAQSVLSGDRNNATTKLTLNDFKSLFSL